MPDNFISYLFFSVCMLGMVIYFVRIFRSKFGPIKKVKATVINKQKVESFSKYSGTGVHTRYAVTFLANEKHLSFYVSEFSYNGYRKGETGTLTYRGDRLIDFS